MLGKRVLPLLVVLAVAASGCVFPWQKEDAPGATTGAAEGPAADAPTGATPGGGDAPVAPSASTPPPAGGSAGPGATDGSGTPPPQGDGDAPRGPILPTGEGDAAACGLDAANADPPRLAPRAPETDGRPPVGVRERDALGAFVARATDADALGRPGIVNEYSKASPWNADGTRLLLQTTDGYRALYDAQGLVFLRYLPLPLGDVEPRWSLTDPERLYYVLENRLCTLHLSSLEASVVARLSGYDRVTGSGEQDLLDLGNGEAAFGLLARRENDAGEALVMDLSVVSFRETPEGVVLSSQTGPTRVYDREALGDLKPDAISLTREHVVVSWSEPYASEESVATPIESVREESGKGMSLYGWDGKFVRKLFRGTHEWDVCKDVAGGDVVVTWGSNDNDPRDTSEGGNKLMMLGLEEPTRATLFTNDWLLSGHVSCRNTAKPGWAFVSSVDETGAIGEVKRENLEFANRILAVRLDASAPQVRAVAETRTQTFDSTGEQHYWREVHVVASKDGSEIAWAANYGLRVDDPLYADTLVARLQPLA